MCIIKGERKEGGVREEGKEVLIHETPVRGKEQADSQAAQLGRTEAASYLKRSVFITELLSSLMQAAGASSSLATLRKVC